VIVKKEIDERSYYGDIELALSHFPDISKPRPEIEVWLEKLENTIDFDYALDYVLDYLKKNNDRKICEAFLKMGAQSTESKYLPLAVYFVKGMNKENYKDLVEKYEPQAEKRLADLPESDLQPRMVKTVDGNEVAAEVFYTNSVFISSKEDFVILAAVTYTSNYKRKEKCTIHDIKESAESAVKLIRKTGKIQTPVLFVDDKQISNPDVIYDMLHRQFKNK